VDQPTGQVDDFSASKGNAVETSDWITAILSGLALIVSAFGVVLARQANRASATSNTKADEANTIAHDANKISQSANAYAREANMLSEKANVVAQKTFDAEYLPDIRFRIGSGQDLTTSPPITYLSLSVGNHGKLPVKIQSVGFSVVGSMMTVPIFPMPISPTIPFPELPTTLLAGDVLEIPIELTNFRQNLKLNSKDPDDEFIFRLMQPTMEFFDSFRLRVHQYLQEEPPIRVRFQQGPPPQPANAAGEDLDDQRGGDDSQRRGD
jgi:hypothetical protein